jgi:hypothetical protein
LIYGVDGSPIGARNVRGARVAGASGEASNSHMISENLER